MLIQPSGLKAEHVTLEVRSLGEGGVRYRCKMPVPSTSFFPRFLKKPATHRAANCPTRLAKLFIPDPTLDILGIVFHSSAFTMQSFTVVLGVYPFLRKCQQLVDTADAATTSPPPHHPHGGPSLVPVFEWEAWGPTVTRWLPFNHHGEYGSRMMHGSRLLVILFRSGSLPAGMATMLLDFNPRPIRRGWRPPNGNDDPPNALSTPEASQYELVDNPRNWVGYGKVVSSSLPYRAMISPLNHRYLNLFMDANTIVGRLVSFLFLLSYI